MKYISQAIQALSINPFGMSNLNIKKLVDPVERGTFRLKVRNHRVIYDVDTSNKFIIVYRVKQRKEGY